MFFILLCCCSGARNCLLIYLKRTSFPVSLFFFFLRKRSLKSDSSFFFLVCDSQQKKAVLNNLPSPLCSLRAVRLHKRVCVCLEAMCVMLPLNPSPFKFHLHVCLSFISNVFFFFFFFLLAFSIVNFSFVIFSAQRSHCRHKMIKLMCRY